MTTYLSLDNLLALVDDLGVGPMREVGLLDGAAHRPSAEHFGTEFYVGLDVKAAALLEFIVRNHPLVDGNKRLGWLALVVFYGLNGEDLEAPDDEAYDLVIDVASGRVDLAQVAQVLSRWH